MEAQTMIPAAIEARISAAREHLASLDGEAKALALPAVSGDRNAADALASVHRSIARVAADLAVLENARLSAVRQQQEADAAETAAYRAEHFEVARSQAREIAMLAASADQLIASLRKLLADMASAESKIWQELKLANAQPADAIVGRYGLGRFVIEQIMSIMDGSDRFKSPRPVAATASVAWAELLGSDNGSEAAA